MIIVETVGVGQSESEISSLADTTVLVLQPNSGDSIQAIKAGVMEIPDIFCINKINLFENNDVERLYRELRERRIPIIKLNAVSGEGTNELIEAIADHRDGLGEDGLQERRRRSLVTQMTQLSIAYSGAAVRKVLDSATGRELLEEVGSRRKDPFTAAKELRELI